MPPSELPSIPDNAHLLAWDHHRRKVVAYDVNRKFLGNVATPHPRSIKRQAKGTACTLVDQSTLRFVTGYHLLEESATAQWGADWDNIHTNPSEYPDRGASVCVQDVPPTMTLDGSPSCTTADSKGSETSTQAGGVLSLAYERGTSTELDMSVTKASLFPWLDGPMLAKVNTPSLASNLESFPAEVTILNQDTATASLSGNSLRNTTVSATASAGQTCSLALTKTSCTGTAIGRVQVSARGWLWVNYPSQRDGHYFWAISIDQTIADIEQRSSYMEFKATAKSSGFTAGTPRCAFANGAPGGGAPQENNVVPAKGVSPVLIAVPVALSILAVILGIVAFVVWRRRKRDQAGVRLSQATQSTNNSTHPQVHPIWLPPASTAPPSTVVSAYNPGRPSIDTNPGMVASPAQGGRVSEKYRAMATLDAMSPVEHMPPAYSEAPSQSTTSGAGSAAR